MRITDIVFKYHGRGKNDIEFTPHDADETADPKYYGFATPDGAFMIMKDTGGTAFRYYLGETTYEASWIARASLTYDYIYNL